MTRLFVSATLLLVFVVAACGGSSEPKSPVHGLLTQLHVDGSGALTSFAMTDDSGKTWEFAFQPAPGAAVAATHLQTHVDQKLPVKVSFYGKGTSRVATRIDDG